MEIASKSSDFTDLCYKLAAEVENRTDPSQSIWNQANSILTQAQLIDKVW